MMTLRNKLELKLAKIPGLEISPFKDTDLICLFYKGKDFAHFHDDNELDLRLTKGVIKRERVVRPTDSIHHPKRSANSPWVELRFFSTGDLAEIERLVGLAIEQI